MLLPAPQNQYSTASCWAACTYPNRETAIVSPLSIRPLVSASDRFMFCGVPPCSPVEMYQRPCCTFLLLGLLFDPEDGGSTYLLYVDGLLQDCALTQHCLHFLFTHNFFWK